MKVHFFTVYFFTIHFSFFFFFFFGGGGGGAELITLTDAKFECPFKILM